MKRAVVFFVIVSLAPTIALGQQGPKELKMQTPPVFRGDPNPTGTDPQSLANLKWRKLRHHSR